jgi:hypothetical protein
VAKDSGVKPADFGDVSGPATNTADYIPQWDGVDSKTLKNGLPASTFEPALGNPTSDDMVLSSKTDGTRSWVEGGSDVDFATPAEVTGVHTTGSITAADDEMTVASATGIVPGMYVVGEGITPGTTVSTVVSTTVTLSANAGVTLSSDPVGFYLPDVALSPGNTAGMLCRAWVNFNGTGTVAIMASFNVSSITDNGTGDYTVNFTTAMPDAKYSASGSASGGDIRAGGHIGGGVFSTTSFRFSTREDFDASASPEVNAKDGAVVTLHIFR